MTIKGNFFGLLLGKVNELNARGFKFALGKPSLSNHKMLISLEGKVFVDFVIETEGEKFFLTEDGKRIVFSKEALADYMIILANNGRKSLELYNLLKSQVEELGGKGLKFILGEPVLKGRGVLISVEGKTLVSFVVCQKKGDIFSLNDEGKTMYFLGKGLVNYLLIKANGGPETGKLMPENWQEEHFKHLRSIVMS